MDFVVQLLREPQEDVKPDVVRTIVFESDDLFSIVARMRIILSSRDYYPTVSAFQIVDGAQVLYYETRQSPDDCLDDAQLQDRRLSVTDAV